MSRRRMAEIEWLTGETRPMAMVEFAERTTNARKLHLVSVAGLRLIDDLLAKDLQQYVDLLESYAEQAASSNDLAMARLELQEYRRPLIEGGYQGSWQSSAHYALIAALDPAIRPGNRRCLDWIVTARTSSFPPGVKQAAQGKIREVLCGIVREILGNPFHPWKSVPEFLGSGWVQPDGRTVNFSEAVLGIAREIHALRAFDRLPILADALEESGVTDAEILDHCRNGTNHLRGCWALDVARGVI